MRGIFNFILRFLSLDHQNMIPEVLVCAALVWLLVLFCTVASILSHPISRGGKALWILFVLLAPLAGVVVYVGYCLSRQDYSFMKAFISSGETSRTLRKPG